MHECLVNACGHTQVHVLTCLSQNRRGLYQYVNICVKIAMVNSLADGHMLYAPSQQETAAVVSS